MKKLKYFLFFFLFLSLSLFLKSEGINASVYNHPGLSLVKDNAIMPGIPECSKGFKGLRGYQALATGGRIEGAVVDNMYRFEYSICTMDGPTFSIQAYNTGLNEKVYDTSVSVEKGGCTFSNGTIGDKHTFKGNYTSTKSQTGYYFFEVWFNISFTNPNMSNPACLISGDLYEAGDTGRESLDEQKEQTKTTKGIWETIKEIFSTIVNLPAKIWELMKSGFDAITNALTNLGNLIKGFFETLLTGILDGLKELFIPTNDQLYEIVNDSKDLTENFGFVGESVNFFLSIFTSFLGLVNSGGCVELPAFEIGATSLFDSFKFWDAQNVCLSDNPILSQNIDTIRTITSIVLVGLFISFASSKFFHILSKNDSGSSVTYDDNSGKRG